MQLLVSTAGAHDVLAALAGGADIIDAKDPTTGALGAVAAETLVEIRSAAERGSRPTSAALGDALDAGELERAAYASAAAGVDFVKVGFLGVASVERTRELLSVAVRGAEEGGGARVVGVAYADADRTRSPAPEAIVEAAARAGAVGVLLDTAFKTAGALFSLMRPEAVGQWLQAARAASLTTALAGRLDEFSLPVARELGADIVGVRSAACEGGRNGRVSSARVRLLKALAANVPLADVFVRAKERLESRHIRRGDDGASDAGGSHT